MEQGLSGYYQRNPTPITGSFNGKSRAVIGELINEVSAGSDDLTPAELVADAGDALPGQPGTARSDIEVVRHEPLVAVAEPPLIIDADDAVPVGAIREVSGKLGALKPPSPRSSGGAFMPRHFALHVMRISLQRSRPSVE